MIKLYLSKEREDFKMKDANKLNRRYDVKNIIILMIALAIFCMLSWYETHYIKEATVHSIRDNIVTVIDDYDNYWEFEAEGFQEGNRVKMLMDTMHTESNIYDDEIQRVTIMQ